MKDNPFWPVWKLSGKKSLEAANEVGLSLPTFRAVVGQPDVLPGHLKLDTLEMVATELGQRVVITLVPLDNGSEAK